MPVTVQARVRNGRLVLDEPSDLPEGTEVELVSVDTTSGFLAAAHAPLDETPLTDVEQSRIDKHRAGESRFVPSATVRAKLDARK